MPDSRTSPIEDALAERRWDDALALLDAAGDAADTAVGLDQRARAAYGAGDFEVAIDSWDRQYVLLRDSGDRAGAAQAAATVAMFLMIDTGLMAPVRVWVNRAGLLLDGMEDNPVHATLAAIHGYERFMCGDLDGARPSAAAAIDLGERLGNPAAVVIGRTASARVTILAGDLADGLAQLEHVGTLLLSGEVDDLTTGMMLCELVCAAQGLALHEMAAEWTDAMERWGPGGAFGGLHGRCRVHRAEILRVSGPCDAAEAEALGACDDLRPWMRREFGWPLAELGTIRLRKGDLDGAEEAFVAAHGHVWCPHPGLALVQLERGDLETARALIDEAIEHPFRNPSKERPPFGDLGLAPLLEAQVEIAAAAGDATAARAATDRLGTIAERYRSPWLAASRALAAARTALAENAPADAIEAANEAIAGWAEIGAPYETATARLVLAEALHRAGNEAAAALERQAAASTFDAYGSPGRAAAARAVSAPGPAPAPEPAPSPAAFARDGDIRVVTFAGHTTRVRDLKGLRYIARMLADPGREFHVLDLVAVEQGTLPTGSPEVVGNAEIDGLEAGAGIAALDEQARESYRRRLVEIEDDIAEAHRNNDPARAELAERDREYLVAELSRAVGLGGRMRAVGSDAERARTAVARAIKYALGRLAEHHPEVVDHLENCLRTGTYCSYRPDPAAAVTWTD